MNDRTVVAFAPRPAPTGFALLPGRRLQQTRRYRLLAQIGEGGMGQVWSAIDEALDREVAIKFLKPEVPPAYRRRFRREARIGATFDHPNLLRVLDAGSDSGTEWLAMDRLTGHDLGALVEEQGRIGIPLAIEIFARVLDALEVVHERRLVHRDIKPFNVFIARNGGARGSAVKLIDFGICRNLGVPEAAEEHVVGDPRYMPPEQARLGAPIDHRADLYALGLTFVQVATGHHPLAQWFDAPVAELLTAHTQAWPWSIADVLPGGVDPHLREDIAAFVATACAPDPDRRFCNAAAMRRALCGLRPARHLDP
jgi:serine/threonine-protein kinase